MKIPRHKSFDSSLALYLDPYRFISKNCKNYHNDLFETRIMLNPVICMSGKDAAEIFYDDSKFMRANAMFMRIQKTLTGVGGIQGLDGLQHLHRKQMMMSFMTQENIAQLTQINEKFWHQYLEKWRLCKDPIIFYDEICEVLTRSVCEWCGVELEENEVKLRSFQLKMMFDGAGSIGPLHMISRWSRLGAQNWLSKKIIAIRQNGVNKNDALHIIANFKEIDGNFLDAKIAAVELLNLLRPCVAISVYLTFIVHAFHMNEDWRHRLSISCDENNFDAFVREVRRFYPFFPAVMARVSDDFEWRGYRFKKNTRAMLDLYGTNHDERSWDEPNVFYPERFYDWRNDQFSFIPQGGGTAKIHHRCAGEDVTSALMKLATKFLAKKIEYELPHQNMEIDFSRLPALPHSKILMRVYV